MSFFQFLIQEWMLTSLLAVLVIVYTMRERVKSGVPITNNQLTALVNADKAVVLDIRPSAEFKAGHLVDAINIPYERINSDLATLEKYKSKTIIIVDKMGQYAGTAGRQLAKEGFDVRRLSGGISEWQNQNLPLVKGK
ncbi:rhodanese-like domain-containing protein [Cellvibrio sp.]|uniref:rhodanese-like domain-containing protein n=1 Tax=Cellvibrio sp. TaxID=1965322 RepID=UPI003964746A